MSGGVTITSISRYPRCSTMGSRAPIFSSIPGFWSPRCSTMGSRLPLLAVSLLYLFLVILKMALLLVSSFCCLSRGSIVCVLVSLCGLLSVSWFHFIVLFCPSWFYLMVLLPVSWFRFEVHCLSRGFIALFFAV